MKRQRKPVLALLQLLLFVSSAAARSSFEAIRRTVNSDWQWNPPAFKEALESTFPRWGPQKVKIKCGVVGVEGSRQVAGGAAVLAVSISMHGRFVPLSACVFCLFARVCQTERRSLKSSQGSRRGIQPHTVCGG